MNNEQRLEKAQASAVQKYGRQYVNSGDSHYRLNVVPTPSLMLDYQLGIGGFPYGHAVEIFGANKLGKSSAIGYGVLANVQKRGPEGKPGLPALIAVEPRFTTPEDREWALNLELDPTKMLIQYPDNAEQAFDMLRNLVFENLVDYIMIDSIGGMGTEAGAVTGGKKQAYGASSTITSGLNDVMPKVYKNNIGLLLVNQQRQSGAFKGTILYDSAGGEALKHHMRIRIHLKPGEKFTASVDGESIQVGQELICHMIKNNMAQSSNKKANFNFYAIATEEYGFGVDKVQDIINVGKMTGVIQGGTWLEHPSFGKKLQGKPAVREFLNEHPEAIEVIRQDVLRVMIEDELAAAKRKKERAARATMTKVKAA